MCCGYSPTKSLINKFAYDMGKVLDSYIGNYDNFLIVGDLNSKVTESLMHEFCNSCDLHINPPVPKIRKNHHVLIFF